jgi:3-oxoacyl-[acyl-carrier protein] reductase/pteridine reductase
MAKCQVLLSITIPSMDRSKPLSGKTAVITGGARRLGRAIALELAQAGADVAITFRNSAGEAQHTVIDLGSFGVRAVALRCDITDEKSVRSAIKETVKELGGIDILVNNAANYETAEFGALTLQQWDAIFASNTRGPFLVSREALKHLRERRGKIINMGSLGGLRPWASHAHYCSSKAAVHMLTKVMAKALAPEIAVNCVAPGMIDLGEKAAASFMKKMARQTRCGAMARARRLLPRHSSSLPRPTSSPGRSWRWMADWACDLVVGRTLRSDAFDCHLSAAIP